jgi:hypothetical protein
MSKKYSIDEIKKACMVLTLSDGSRWSLPISVIAENRANFYKDEFDGDIQRSLDEDTWTLFAEDDYEIYDWAGNNMDWDDVEHHLTRLPSLEKVLDYYDEWASCEKEIAI